MTLGDRCDHIIALIDEVLTDVAPTADEVLIDRNGEDREVREPAEPVVV